METATKLIVGLADMKITGNPTAMVTAYLGPCIGVAIHDPVARVGGILHFMLPDSALDAQKADDNPWMFADTGIPLFLEQAYKLGAEKARMKVTVAGGSQIADDGCGSFNTGKSNYTTLRKILWMNNVLIHNEEVGGNVNRILTIKLSSGSVEIKSLRDGIREGEKSYSKDLPISYPSSLAHGHSTTPEVSGYSRFTAR